MDLRIREKRIKRLWNWTFIFSVGLIAGLFGSGVYTRYNPDPWFPYVFGSLALAVGSQLVLFGPDWDRIIAKESPELAKGAPLSARSFGFFFMFIGAGMIVVTLLEPMG